MADNTIEWIIKPWDSGRHDAHLTIYHIHNNIARWCYWVDSKCHFCGQIAPAAIAIQYKLLTGR